MLPHPWRDPTGQSPGWVLPLRGFEVETLRPALGELLRVEQTAEKREYRLEIKNCESQPQPLAPPLPVWFCFVTTTVKIQQNSLKKKDPAEVPGFDPPPQDEAVTQGSPGFIPPSAPPRHC